MSYTIEATAPFDYRVTILPAVRTFVMGEIYDVTIDDTVGEIPSASFRLLTAKVADEDLVAKGIAVQVDYNGACRFQGVVTRILKREDAPVWEVDCEGGLMLLREEGIAEVVEYKDTPGDEVLTAVLPTSWTLDSPVLPKISLKTEYGTVLEVVDKVVKNAGYEAWAEYVGTGWTLHVVEGRGSASSVATWQINRQLYGCQREQDDVRNPTVAIVPGATAETQDRGAVIARFSAHEATTIVDEPWLTASIDEVATEIPCSWTEDLTPEGSSSGIVHIGTERIAFSGMTETSLTGCTRGYQNTTAAPHDAGDGVLRVISYPLSDTTGWPASGSFWCGAEKIHYASLGYGEVFGLSRGHVEDGKATGAYNHRPGVLCVLCDVGTTTYSKEVPEDGSPIALHGVRTVRLDGTGLDSMADLELAATRKLLGTAGELEGGTAKLADTSFRTNLVTGDHVTVQEQDSPTTTLYRVTGMVFEMATATIELRFNMPRSFFREDLADIARTRTRTDSRKPLGDMAAVALVSADKTSMLVTRPDGSQVWAKCGLRPAL
jgi:hypothetical protein